jgi:hypothetical protein
MLSGSQGRSHIANFEAGDARLFRMMRQDEAELARAAQEVNE